MKTLLVALLAIAFNASAAEGITVYPGTDQQAQQTLEDRPLAALGLPEASAATGSSAAMVVSPAMPLLQGVQDELKKRGYNVEPDGVLSIETRAALVNFQAKNNLIATGRPDRETAALLGLP